MIASTETTQVNLRLPADLARRLRLRAADERRYAAHVAADAIREFLDRAERKDRKGGRAAV